MLENTMLKLSIVYLLQSMNLAHVCINADHTAGYIAATDTCKFGYAYLCDAGDFPENPGLVACCNNKGVCTMTTSEEWCTVNQEHVCSAEWGWDEF